MSKTRKICLVLEERSLLHLRLQHDVHLQTAVGEGRVVPVGVRIRIHTRLLDGPRVGQVTGGTDITPG